MGKPFTIPHVHLRINSAADSESHLNLLKFLFYQYSQLEARKESGKIFPNLQSPHIFVDAGVVLTIQNCFRWGFKRFVQAVHFKTIQMLCY